MHPFGRGPRIAAVAFVGVLAVVGGGLYLSGALGGDADASGSVGPTAIVADLGACDEPVRDPSPLPDFFYRDGFFWTMSTEDLALVSSTARDGSEVLDAYPTKSTELGRIGPASEHRDIVHVPEYLKRDMESLRNVPGRVLGISSVGGAKSRDYAGLRGMAYISPTGDVVFAGRCARSLYTDTLERFRVSVDPESTGIEVLTRLISDQDLQAKLDDFVYGPPEPGWDERPPELRSLLDDDVPRGLADRLAARVVELDFSGLEAWQSTGLLLCSSVAGVAMGECVILEPDGFTSVKANFDAVPEVSVVLLDEGSGHRLLIGTIPLNSEHELGEYAKVPVEFTIDPPKNLAELMAATDSVAGESWLRRIER